MELYFIGIKGAGMSSLALIAQTLGYKVSGSDVDGFIFTQDALSDAGIEIKSFNEKNITENMTVVIGNSFDTRNQEVKKAYELESVKVYRYFEFLSEIMRNHTSIAVAGSHGKTTTTGMLTNLLKPMKSTGYLIGDGTGKLTKDDEYFVVEADEYKDTFLNYHPDYAIVTNIDLDHVDYFKSMEQYLKSYQTFINQINKGVVYWGDDPYLTELNYEHLDVLTYGFNENNNILAQNIVEQDHQTTFELMVEKNSWGQVTLDFVGRHNLLNMLGSVTLAHMLGENQELILKHIHDFKGQHRRFIVQDFGDYVYIDDYAHHPTEIRVTIEAARTRFKDKKLILVYKPDRLSRAQFFEKQFKEAMALADTAYITHFYSGARAVEDIPYDIYDFQKAIGNVEILTEDYEGATKLAKEGPAVYLFVSTKDVYLFKDQLKEIQHKEL